MEHMEPPPTVLLGSGRWIHISRCADLETFSGGASSYHPRCGMRGRRGPTGSLHFEDRVRSAPV